MPFLNTGSAKEGLMGVVLSFKCGVEVRRHRDEARSVDRKPRTSQLLTPLTLAMG